MCGRSDFMVHGCACCKPGDNKNPPTAGCSSGCIILSYENRKKLRVGDSLIVEHFEPTAQMLVKAWMIIKLNQLNKAKYISRSINYNLWL